MLSSKVDYSVLQELKLASSLVEAPNIDKKPNIKKLENMFKNIEDTNISFEIIKQIRAKLLQKLQIIAIEKLIQKNTNLKNQIYAESGTNIR